MKYTHLPFTTYALAVVCVVFIASCGGPPQGDSDITRSQIEEANARDKTQAAAVRDIFHAVPSPMEMASILKKVGAQYDPSMLNDVKKVSNYTTTRSMALNLGVYGADLSYASVFNQNQEAIIFLSCAKKLADNLGVTKAFNDETLERIEANVDNRDSLLNIISETYYELDAYLKENGREYVSAMIVAAGWVEGLHISTTIAAKDAKPEPIMLERIAEQKISLGNLIKLVAAYNSEGQVDEVAKDLTRLEEAFSKVKIVQGAAGVTTASDGVPVIGSPNTIEMSDEVFTEIRKTVSEIRSRYVS